MGEEIKQKILEFAKILYEEDFEISIRCGENEKRRGNLIFVECGWLKEVTFKEFKNELSKNSSRITELFFVRGNKFLGCTMDLKISDLDKEIKISGHSITLRLILKEEN